MCGDTMRKRDLLTLLTNETRLTIIQRLQEAKKAAYSDLVDSVDTVRRLTSTGNFNYHLKFLMKNGVVVHDGSVYRLSPKGEIVHEFLMDVELKWRELRDSLRGDQMNVYNHAEQFEEETGVKMERESIDFQGHEMILDESKTLGLVQLKKNDDIFSSYAHLPLEKFRLSRRQYVKKNRNEQEVVLLEHPDIEYEISPKWFGLLQAYLEDNYGRVIVFARQDAPAPFIVTPTSPTEEPQGCSFILAPSVFEPSVREKVPDKKS